MHQILVFNAMAILTINIYPVGPFSRTHPAAPRILDTFERTMDGNNTAERLRSFFFFPLP